MFVDQTPELRTCVARGLHHVRQMLRTAAVNIHSPLGLAFPTRALRKALVSYFSGHHLAGSVTKRAAPSRARLRARSNTPSPAAGRHGRPNGTALCLPGDAMARSRSPHGLLHHVQHAVQGSGLARALERAPGTATRVGPPISPQWKSVAEGCDSLGVSSRHSRCRERGLEPRRELLPTPRLAPLMQCAADRGTDVQTVPGGALSEYPLMAVNEGLRAPLPLPPPARGARGLRLDDR
jgi:hypothetical protein